MPLTDWTGELSGNRERVISSAVTRTGTGSLQFKAVSANDSGKWLSRSVTDPQVRTLFWAQKQGAGSIGNAFQIDHDQYGDLEILSNVLSGVWRQFRCTFWYDSVKDKRFGRREFRDDEGDAFTQIGGDEDFGAGKPVAGKLRMGGGGNQTGLNIYIDDQIVQDARL